MKNFSLVFLILFTFTNGYTQSYSIKRLSMEEGMSSNYTVDIEQDKEGYIWIATESGLNRFDGKTFTVYNKQNSGLINNDLHNILADSIEKKLWIVTLRNGVYIYDYMTGEITPFPIRNDSTDNSVRHLSLASNKGIWITNSRHGIDYYDRTTKTITPYTDKEIKGLKMNGQLSMDDGQGHLYIGHNGEGLSILNLKDKSIRNYTYNPQDPYSIPNNVVNSICIDNNKNIWIGTNHGLALFNPQNEKFTRFKHIEGNNHSLLSNQIYDIKQMKDGSLWICCYMGGVSILNFQANTFSAPENVQFYNISATNDRYGFSSPNARCVLQDSFGNIWIGNWRGGVDFISHTQPIFDIIDYHSFQSDKSSHKQVWGVWADKDNIWIGGENELVKYYNKKVTTINLRSIQNHAQTHINVMHMDKAQRLWLGLYRDGVAIYDTQHKKLQRIVGNIPKDLDVRCFHEDANGKIFIGTEQGVYSYNNHRWTKEDSINQLLTGTNIRSIIRDLEGNLWIANTGLDILSPSNKRIHTFTQNNGFPSNAINHLFKDSKNRIWVASRNGLILFEKGIQTDQFQHFNMEEKLNNSEVRAIQEDLKGNIWISTNGGISLFNEKEKVFNNYTHHDGVPLGDFMDGSACISPEGIIHFGSQNGVCHFNPDAVSTPRKVSPVSITKFLVYDKITGGQKDALSIPLAHKEIELSYQQNTFNISFNVLDYSQSSQVEFAYMLKGLSNEWYNTQGENQVTFRNIPYGEYTFNVKARFRNQEWEETDASIQINILPPVWLRWYAKLLYLIIITFLILFVIKMYKHRLVLQNSLKLQQEKEKSIQELNDERLRFFTNITHELRTPLTLILGPLEDLLSDKTLTPKHNHKINIIHESSLRLLNLINQILEFRKTETQNRKLSVSKGNIANLIKEVGYKYKELNQNEKVTYHIHIDTKDTELFFDADMVMMILDNLMSNAAKYTSTGDIHLRLQTIEENLIKYTEISVTDTGYGISAQALPHIFDRYYQAKGKHQASGSGIGLALVKGLVDLHEANLTVESTQGVGTSFKLRLLTENTYPDAIHVNTTTELERQIPEDIEDENISSEEGRPIILIVEDNSDIREYIRSSFCDIYEIITADDGQQGWEMIQSQIPDVIVSDIMMPIMDGLELCRMVKSDIRTSHIPIILLTAKDSLKDKEDGYDQGADSYLTKPFSAKLLHSRIHNLLEVRKKIASSITATSVLQTQEDDETDKSLNKLDHEFLQKITNIIEENMELDKMDIGFIAEKMCMSHSTLYRKIKGLTSMSANEFIRKIKMQKSLDLLDSGNYTISEISYMLGFSTTAYFRQCFKNEYGKSPSEYQRKK